MLVLSFCDEFALPGRFTGGSQKGKRDSQEQCRKGRQEIRWWEARSKKKGRCSSQRAPGKQSSCFIVLNRTAQARSQGDREGAGRAHCDSHSVINLASIMKTDRSVDGDRIERSAMECGPNYRFLGVGSKKKRRTGNSSKVRL